MNPMIQGTVHAPLVAQGRHLGFTLIELVIAVLIVSILAAVAYPSYMNSVARTRRAAAEACLANYTTQMERYYTTNMAYNRESDGTMMSDSVLQGYGIDCASDANTGLYYTYGFAATEPTATTYTLIATPIGAQAERDEKCGILSITHTGARGVSGSDGVDKCW